MRKLDGTEENRKERIREKGGRKGKREKEGEFSPPPPLLQRAESVFLGPQACGKKSSMLY